MPAAGEKESAAIGAPKSFQLKLEGNSLRAIASIVGVSHVQVRDDILDVLETFKVDGKDIESMRAIENERIDALWNKAYTEAIKEFGPSTEAAMRSCIALMKRRAELNGLDMPIKITAVGLEHEYGIEEARRIAVEKLSRIFAGYSNPGNNKGNGELPQLGTGEKE